MFPERAPVVPSNIYQDRDGTQKVVSDEMDHVLTETRMNTIDERFEARLGPNDLEGSVCDECLVGIFPVHGFIKLILDFLEEGHHRVLTMSERHFSA